MGILLSVYRRSVGILLLIGRILNLTIRFSVLRLVRICLRVLTSGRNVLLCLRDRVVNLLVVFVIRATRTCCLSSVVSSPTFVSVSLGRGLDLVLDMVLELFVVIVVGDGASVDGAMASGEFGLELITSTDIVVILFD